MDLPGLVAGPQVNLKFTCVTSTTVQILTLLFFCTNVCVYIQIYDALKLTCFTSTKVQILTLTPLQYRYEIPIWCMLTYADLCWRMPTYADICGRTLTYADVRWRTLTPQYRYEMPIWCIDRNGGAEAISVCVCLTTSAVPALAAQIQMPYCDPFDDWGRSDSNALLRSVWRMRPLRFKCPTAIRLTTDESERFFFLVLTLWSERAQCLSGLGERAVSLKLLVNEALSYWFVRPEATSVWGLELLVYEVLSYMCKYLCMWT